MAIIRYSSLVSELLGSIGMLTFQKCNGVNSIRTKPFPRSSPSETQTLHRSYFNSISQAFDNLSSSQLSAWSLVLSYLYPSAGKMYQTIIQLRQLFIQYHLLAYPQRLDILTNPELSSLYNYEWLPVIELDAGVLSLVLTDDITWSVYGQNVSMSLPSVSNNLSKSVKFKSIYLDKNDGSVFDITDSYKNAFGAILSVGDFVCVKTNVYSEVTPIAKRLSTQVIEVVAP